MVEITSEEQTNVKRMQRTRIVSDISGTISNTPTFELQGSQKKEKKKGYEKIFEEIRVDNFPNLENEVVSEVQEAQSPIQDKPKEKHAKTHTSQPNKD